MGRHAQAYMNLGADVERKLALEPLQIRQGLARLGEFFGNVTAIGGVNDECAAVGYVSQVQPRSGLAGQPDGLRKRCRSALAKIDRYQNVHYGSTHRGFS